MIFHKDIFFMLIFKLEVIKIMLMFKQLQIKIIMLYE